MASVSSHKAECADFREEEVSKVHIEFEILKFLWSRLMIFLYQLVLCEDSLK